MRRERLAGFVREQTGLRRGSPVVVQQHLRGGGWVVPRHRVVLTEGSAEGLTAAGVDLVRIRRWGRSYEVRLPMCDPRDGPSHKRATFVSVWDAVARS